MKILWLLPLLFVFSFADELSQKTKDLKENERISKQLGKKLDDLAKDILANEKNLNNLAGQIQKLSQETLKLEENAKLQNKELKTLNSQNQDLLKDKNAMENKLVSLIAENFAFDLPIPSGYIESEESFIAFELLNSLDEVFKEEFYRLSKDYELISKQISAKQDQIDKINTNLKKYNDDLSKLEKLKLEQIDEIKRQKTDKDIYTKKLNDVQKQQVELRDTLAQLKIVSEKQEKPSTQNTSNQAVRQLGSSYQNAAVKKYKGQKTIAPLDSFIIKQKFGNFTDPIYNIKIFNENVILRSKTADARVKSVFGGKVVFAKETNLLQRVVIIEHNNGLHTIYAHLDKISPTLKVGKNVKKGEVLGRVKNDLTFEVTQEKFHINPLELISLN
ncbi:murein hydrolase activator EnvC family protein [Campylobacter sp. MIT 97-5078]|uniref:murein hydrolase activator EnvC family protein n=1 Tax=Campylobacter sp. MIT 97-5078 TaxID=1548153 RepID=UPI000513F7CB|nr:M23 family metallopeptidase [Campylobacter sp. MIT 97-5078]KGI56379.1 peptidase M23 [Campylobacter sp. MIT 97-5078]KGI56883.1 peptidase M23 [Campylobacter sp. MIT 97-5078]KGI56906.1 peptidase M23 [Campylobacter sp. MIT 97-5078]TQR26714.1 peptidase M23 [Campylobacter sp. MIT 97-5078]